MGLIYRIRKKIFNHKWRKLNSHNFTTAREFFMPENVHVGNNTYGEVGVLIFDEKYHLRIGNYCSIGPNVQFLLSADHATNHISSYPFKSYIVGRESEGVGKGDIVVEDDVWIGYGAIILSGVHIGQGAVVAAGAVVTRDVPPYSVVGGVPAKVLRYRFSKPIIEYLINLDYAALTKEMVLNHVNELYEIVESEEGNIEKRFEWFPKKSN